MCADPVRHHALTSPVAVTFPSAGCAEPADASQTQDLLIRSGTGDTKAFAALYDHVSPFVFGRVSQAVSDPARRDQVTHAVLIEVWRSASVFNPDDEEAHAWLCAVTLRVIAEHELSWAASERGRLPFAPQTRSRFAWPAVHLTELHLTELHRCVLQLARRGGHSRQEIAAIIDRPLATVTTGIRDGLLQLHSAGS